MTPPPPMSLPTTDVAAAANDTDWVEGTLFVTGNMCIKSAPVNPVATHSFTAQTPMTTPQPTSSWKTYQKAAANDTDVAMGMLVLMGDFFVQSKSLRPLATVTAETWPTALPTTHVTTAQGRVNPLNVPPCELAVSGVVCRCWVECMSRVAMIHCLA